MILVGDCIQQMKTLPDQSVDCCVTSPPYWGLRDYGHSNQIGLEETPELFVEKMVLVFSEVHRVLKNSGTLWLNLGDTYFGGGNNRGNGKGLEGSKQASNRGAQGQVSKVRKLFRADSDLKKKDLCGIPWRVAFALQKSGWYLRQDIIWHKPNPMPESVNDRCTKAHEYIFMLSKSERYYFDADSISEKCTGTRVGVTKERGATPLTAMRGDRTNSGGFSRTKETKNKRSVWTVTTKPFKGAHFATFPMDLIEPCVLAGCPSGGTVLDPFFGAGTTGLCAVKNQRKYVGIELNPEYALIAENRIRDFSPLETFR